MSVSTVFMPNMHKRFRCISLRVNNWFLAFGLFEGNAKHLPRMWHTVSLRRLKLSVQGCLTNTVVQDGDPCEQALQRCIQMCEWSTLWVGKPNYFYFTAIVHLHKYICGYYFITLQILHRRSTFNMRHPCTCSICLSQPFLQALTFQFADSVPHRDRTAPSLLHGLLFLDAGGGPPSLE